MGPKSHFLDFFKVVLELFRKCLGIVFRIKKPTFSPLGSREALKNVNKASPEVFILGNIIFSTYSRYVDIAFTVFST